MMSTRMLFTIVLLLITNLLGIRSVDGFQPSPLNSCKKFNDVATRTLVLASTTNDDDDEEEYMPLTPNQIKTLRKEVSKRRARKELVQDWLPEEETSGPFSEETLEKISTLLKENELVEIRGISKNEKRYVRPMSDELSYDLSRIAGKVVECVQTKGFSTIFYCGNGGIILRSSYQPYQWERRQKPLRDIGGKIIKPRAIYILPAEEKKGPFSESTVTDLSQLLEKHELVLVHGVSEGDKRRVLATSEQLEFDLSHSIGRSVKHVYTTKFSSTFHCPGGKIILRQNLPPKK